MPLALEGRVLTTGSPGNSCSFKLLPEWTILVLLEAPQRGHLVNCITFVRYAQEFRLYQEYIGT